MPSAVWSGHLHFGLVVMPVRLLVAARTKTIRFRRLYRKPLNESTFGTSFFPSFSHGLKDRDSDPTEGIENTQSTFEEMNDTYTAADHQYAAVRQVFQSEETGKEIRPDEMVKGYEIAPNEFAAIDPKENQGSRD